MHSLLYLRMILIYIKGSFHPRRRQQHELQTRYPHAQHRITDSYSQARACQTDQTACLFRKLSNLPE
jgi:hypothetical protein